MPTKSVGTYAPPALFQFFSEKCGLRTRGFFDDEGNALPVMTVFDNSSGN